MAHNTRVRPSAGAWNAGAVAGSEFEQLDANQFASINGDAGGVWAPASAIVIGGAGVEIDGPFTVDGYTHFHNHVAFTNTTSYQGMAWFSGPVEFDAAVEFDSTTNFDGAATFNDSVTLNGHATIGNAVSDALDVRASMTVRENATFQKDLTVLDDVFITDDLTAGGTGTFGSLEALNATLDNITAQTMLVGDIVVSDDLVVNDDCTIQDDLTVGSSVSIGNNLTVGGNATFNGPLDAAGGFTLRTKLNHSGDGRVGVRAVIGANGNASYRVTDCNTIHVATHSGGATKTYTFLEAGSSNGDWFEVTLDGSIGNGRGVDCIFENGGNLATLVAPDRMGAFFRRIDGNWYRTQFPTNNRQ